MPLPSAKVALSRRQETKLREAVHADKLLPRDMPESHYSQFYCTYLLGVNTVSGQSITRGGDDVPHGTSQSLRASGRGEKIV